jgi:hypothetical protein
MRPVKRDSLSCGKQRLKLMRGNYLVRPGPLKSPIAKPALVLEDDRQVPEKNALVPNALWRQKLVSQKRNKAALSATSS